MTFEGLGAWRSPVFVDNPKARLIHGELSLVLHCPGVCPLRQYTQASVFPPRVLIPADVHGISIATGSTMLMPPLTCLIVLRDGNHALQQLDAIHRFSSTFQGLAECFALTLRCASRKGVSLIPLRPSSCELDLLSQNVMCSAQSHQPRRRNADDSNT